MQRALVASLDANFLANVSSANSQKEPPGPVLGSIPASFAPSLILSADCRIPNIKSGEKRPFDFSGVVSPFLCAADKPEKSTRRRLLVSQFRRR
jgi:hypothetical protein